jgi:hypothetical protein
MLNVYSTHNGSQIKLPAYSSIEEVASLAEVHANLKSDTLLRVFSPSLDGGERFVTAFSILRGKVTQHHDVTIPLAHW